MTPDPNAIEPALPRDGSRWHLRGLPGVVRVVCCAVDQKDGAAHVVFAAYPASGQPNWVRPAGEFLALYEPAGVRDLHRL